MVEAFLFKCYERVVASYAKDDDDDDDDDRYNRRLVKKFFINLISGRRGIIRFSKLRDSYFYVSTRSRRNVYFKTKDFTSDDVESFIRDSAIVSEITTTMTNRGNDNGWKNEWNLLKRHNRNRLLENYVLKMTPPHHLRDDDDDNFVRLKTIKSALLLAFVLKLIGNESVTFRDNEVKCVNATIFGFDFSSI